MTTPSKAAGNEGASDRETTRLTNAPNVRKSPNASPPTIPPPAQSAAVRIDMTPISKLSKVGLDRRTRGACATRTDTPVRPAAIHPKSTQVLNNKRFLVYDMLDRAPARLMVL